MLSTSPPCTHLIYCYRECDDMRTCIISMCMQNFERFGRAKYTKGTRETCKLVCLHLSYMGDMILILFFFLIVHNICRVTLNVFLFFFFLSTLIVSVRSTLLVRDNKVWIELMHFALKYYSILTWCNEQVNERVNVRLGIIKQVCGLLRKAGTWMTTAEQRMAKWVLYTLL